MIVHRVGRTVGGMATAIAVFTACSAATVTLCHASGLVGTRAAHLAAAQPQPSAAEISKVRVENDSTGARLVFELNAPVQPKTFVLAGPDRAIVDLPQIDFKIDPAVGRQKNARGRKVRSAALVTSFRFGLLSPGRSRIVIDLGAPARLVAAIPKKVGDHYELAVVLSKTDRSVFRAAARSGAAAAPASVEPATPVTAAAEKPVIVLDPGHGGPDNGAMVNGVIEKDVALAFAKALAAKLEANGAFKVVMTRSDDVFIPLSERVRIARAAGAALMVSIHADTLTGTEASDVSGATVYTVSDRASDAYAAKVAAKENAADATVGVDGMPDTADVNDILFDLTRQETRAYSHVFARTLVNYWKVAGRLNKNPQRAAGFVVLKAPDVPSVLLELGYLSSAADAASLTSDAWRDRATGRMAEAIEVYFADRHGPAKAAAGVPIPLRQAAADLQAGHR